VKDKLIISARGSAICSMDFIIRSTGISSKPELFLLDKSLVVLIISFLSVGNKTKVSTCGLLRYDEKSTVGLVILLARFGPILTKKIIKLLHNNFRVSYGLT